MFWNFVCLLFMVLSPVLTAVVQETPGLCSSGEFQCGDGACISLDQACNGKADCMDGRDEEACSGIGQVNPLEGSILHRSRRQASCGRNQWRCRDGTCIGFDGKCDGVVDCPDGSDETFPLCRNMKCQSNWFKCTYGACVDGTAPCNGVQECADDSDELLPRCRNDTEEINGQFRCDNGQLISAADRCDGKPDCADGSDETVRSCAGNKCPGYLFQCAYGACVDEGSDCDNIKECADGSDESDELCNRTATITTTTFAPQTGKCVVPPHPANGRYIVAGVGTAVPGSRFPVLSLNVSCSAGYRPRAEPTVLCVDGAWSGDYPQCTRFCHLNPHESVTYRCLLSGSNSLEGSRICDRDEPDGTIARPECNRPNYYSPAVLPLMRCADGNWDFTPTCQPGLVKHGANVTIIVQDGVQVFVSHFQYGGPAAGAPAPARRRNDTVVVIHSDTDNVIRVNTDTNSDANSNSNSISNANSNANSNSNSISNANSNANSNSNSISNANSNANSNSNSNANANIDDVLTTVGPITEEIDSGRKDYNIDYGDWRIGSNSAKGNNFNFYFNGNQSKILVNAPDSKIYFKD